LRVGLFTSPHLIAFGERMRINGVEIPAPELVSHLEYFRDLVAEWDPHPTFFELTLAVALRHFLQHRCELIILEAGMGGRLDATSAVPRDLNVITPIGLDHQQYLGETLAEIAGEKGAVMRAGVPAVSAPQEPDARARLLEQASEARTNLEFVTAPFTGLRIGLTGAHQAWNAALALEALGTLLGAGALRYDAVKTGLGDVTWRGRFQRLTQPDGVTILDCAHNVPATTALVQTWQQEFPHDRPHLIFGASEDKNLTDVLALLLPLVRSVEVYQLKNPRGAKAEALLALVSSLAPDLPCEVLPALAQARSASHRLVVGSVFLAGEWLEQYP